MKTSSPPQTRGTVRGRDGAGARGSNARASPTTFIVPRRAGRMTGRPRQLIRQISDAEAARSQRGRKGGSPILATGCLLSRVPLSDRITTAPDCLCSCIAQSTRWVGGSTRWVEGSTREGDPWKPKSSRRPARLQFLAHVHHFFYMEHLSVQLRLEARGRIPG